VDVAWRQERPQFEVAIQQLADTELTAATQGCSAGVMPRVRKAVEDAVEASLLGADPQTALSEAGDSLQGELDDYNASVDG